MDRFLLRVLDLDQQYHHLHRNDPRHVRLFGAVADLGSDNDDDAPFPETRLLRSARIQTVMTLDVMLSILFNAGEHVVPHQYHLPRDLADIAASATSASATSASATSASATSASATSASATSASAIAASSTTNTAPASASPGLLLRCCPALRYALTPDELRAWTGACERARFALLSLSDLEVKGALVERIAALECGRTRTFSPDDEDDAKYDRPLPLLVRDAMRLGATATKGVPPPIRDPWRGLPNGWRKHGLFGACLRDGYFMRRFRDRGIWVHVFAADRKVDQASVVHDLLDRSCEGKVLTGVLDAAGTIGSGGELSRFLVTSSSSSSSEDADHLARFFDAMPRMFALCLGCSGAAGEKTSGRVLRRHLEAATKNATNTALGGPWMSFDAADDGDEDNLAAGFDLGCFRAMKKELGRGGGARWWLDLCADVLERRLAVRMLAARLRHEDEQEKKKKTQLLLDRLRSEMVYREFMLRRCRGFARAQQREEDGDKTDKTDEEVDYAMVMVDDRRNPWSVASAITSAQNVDAVKHSWALYFFCSDANSTYVRRALSGFDGRIDLRVREIPQLCARSPHGLERNDLLFESSAFWDMIRARRALIIQDDGVLAAPGVENAAFSRYDYVGAPWEATVQPRLREISNPQMVGNGGLSLRTVAAMREITRRDEEEEENGAGDGGTRLHYNAAQQLPEDVYFASRVHAEEKRKVAPREIAHRFSSEQVLCTGGCLGFHKPWAYHGASNVAAFFRTFS